jgi:hypothetical protein
MAFARYSTDGLGTSLYFVEEARAFPDAIVVASERLDGDGGWRRIAAPPLIPGTMTVPSQPGLAVWFNDQA